MQEKDELDSIPRRIIGAAMAASAVNKRFKDDTER